MTKCDRAAPARLEEVARQIGQLVRGTPLAGAPLFRTAAPRGEGIESLRRWLIDLQARPGRVHHENEAFRLAVDRVFTLPGAGTVVTGSVFSGAVGVDDMVQVAPGGRRARVRSVHAQNRPCSTARAGQRCALSLASLSKDEIARGQWICDPRIALATDRLDARITVWHDQAQALCSGATVHLHVGAADVLARVALLQAQTLPPGAGGLVQLVLRRSVGAWHGDRIVLRDATASRTLAGGRVLDPWAPSRYRKTPQRLAQLAALEQDAAEQRLAALLQAAPTAVAVEPVQRAWSLKSVEPILPRGAVRIGTGEAAWLAGAGGFEGACRALLDALARSHAAEPDSSGIEAARLGRIALPRAPAALAQHAIQTLVAQERMTRDGAFVQLPEHAVRLSEQELRLAQRIVPLLQAGGFDPPWVRDLAHDLKQPEAAVRAALARQSQRGAVFQIVKDLYLHRASVEQLAAAARELALREGMVRAACFRDATGLGRKRAIQILEFFDRIGLLRRVRDAHRVRPGTRLFRPDCTP